MGQAGLVYDLVIRPPQLPAALRLTADLDQVRFALDHAAKPLISGGVLEPWATMIGELAARPNVACKVSGLVTEAGAGWQREQFAPYVDVLLASFGPGRLLFGSDWPVCLLAATYAEVLDPGPRPDLAAPEPVRAGRVLCGQRHLALPAELSRSPAISPGRPRRLS